MIRRIYVDNYKCLVNFELPLQELTLLLGANGGGKTAVLDVLYALRSLLDGASRVTGAGVFPCATLTRWQERPRQLFELGVTLDSDELRYRLEIEHHRATERARIALERLESEGRPLFEFCEGEVHLYRDDHSAGPVFSADWTESALARIPPRRDNTRLTRFLAFMRGLTICGLYPAGFRSECASEDVVLARDGSNFAAWYRHMLQERHDRIPRVEEALREAIDGFCGIQLRQVGVATRALVASFEQSGRRFELRLDELSDGQRALIALYSLLRLAAGPLNTPVPPTAQAANDTWPQPVAVQALSAVFLDEPDNYLALAEIQPWLVELSDACGRDLAQAVICSHHPELIDYLGADHGLVLNRESSGATKVQPVREVARYRGLKLSETFSRGWDR